MDDIEYDLSPRTQNQMNHTTNSFASSTNRTLKFSPNSRGNNSSLPSFYSRGVDGVDGCVDIRSPSRRTGLVGKLGNYSIKSDNHTASSLLNYGVTDDIESLIARSLEAV